MSMRIQSDGMAAAAGRIFIATRDGHVLSLGGPTEADYERMDSTKLWPAPREAKKKSVKTPVK